MPVLLDQLVAAQIDLVEWDQHLLSRLRVPIVTDTVSNLLFLGVVAFSNMHQNLFFLVPDEQIYDACQVAASLEYYPDIPAPLRIAYPSEFSGSCVLYNIEPKRSNNYGHDRFDRLVLLPLSCPGLHLNDLELKELRYPRLPGHTWNIWAVPLAAACTALVRIICAETRPSRFRRRLFKDLVNLIAYNFYGTSCGGTYKEMFWNDLPWSKSQLEEIENAVTTIKSWEMRDGEEWIRENLIKIVSCTMIGNQLPWKDDPKV